MSIHERLKKLESRVKGVEPKSSPCSSCGCRAGTVAVIGTKDFNGRCECGGFLNGRQPIGRPGREVDIIVGVDLKNWRVRA
jgi:hypothetical protein